MRRELEGLGIASEIRSNGRVHFHGDWQTLAKTSLWLRTADRVLLKVADFPAADFDALYESTGQLPWGRCIPVDGEFPVTARTMKSKLTSVPAIQRTVKKAIVESLQRDHASQQLPESGALFKVEVQLVDDHASLTIDTTGKSLHARGYRTDVSKAPLKETMAAALVLLSYWRNGRPLADPFCGSGTILIEAAMIGRNMAPGISRDFAFTRWPGFQTDILRDLRSDAVAGQLESLDLRINGSDSDFRVLKAARDNADRVGVANDIHFEQALAEEYSSRKRFGCLITNPPYGRRLQPDERHGEGRERGGHERERRTERRFSQSTDAKPTRPHSPELDQLYSSLPNVFRRLPTWSHYILTAYPQLERLMDKEADRRRKLYNGRIECTYYQFHGPKPIVEQREENDETKVLIHAEGTAAFGQLDKKSQHQSELFVSRLQKRARHLRRWPTKREITCYRVYERDIPEIPLIIDRYEDHLHIVEYERPHDRDSSQHANWLDLMVATAGSTLDVPRANIHFKSRSRQRGKTQHEKIAHTEDRLTVGEGGLKFFVNLDDYADTGLFLDHRITRSMVRDEAKGKRILNLFAYTGSFTVYAADGAAKSTTTVDLSKRYLQWAQDNLELNGFTGEQHQFHARDVVQFVDQHPIHPTYDVVVLDPPTFSNSKSTEEDWEVQRDAVSLIHRVLPLVTDGGVIYFSTNFRRFRLDESAVNAAQIHEISRQTIPEDYRNRRIHRCWRIVK